MGSGEGRPVTLIQNTGHGIGRKTNSLRDDLAGKKTGRRLG